MCTVIKLPLNPLESVSRFIREESETGRCVLCGAEVGRENGDVVVCEVCRKGKDRVRCARCGYTHIIDKNLSEVHEGIGKNIGLGDNIGAVVSSCSSRDCDKKEKRKDVVYKFITEIK